MKKFVQMLFAAIVSLFAVSLAQAQIVITPFTDALDDVGDAVTGGLGATVTAGLAIAGVIMAGLILWRLFKRVAKA